MNNWAAPLRHNAQGAVAPCHPSILAPANLLGRREELATGVNKTLDMEQPSPVRVFSDTATHYDVLGVDPSVDIVELRRAFTVAAKKYHPDRVGGADAPFKRVQAAWEVVRDEGRRREYDATLTAGRRPRYWESNEPEPTSPRQAAQEQKEKRLKQARAVPVRVRAS